MIGFHSGCAKVIGNFESSLITDNIMQSHCYGDRNMWQDVVEKDQFK